MADALDLLPPAAPALGAGPAGEVRASYARFVCTKTRDLSKDEAAYVDAAVAESADGRIPWTRFEALVEAKVAQAAPAAAREKEERARKATFAKRLRQEEPGWARSWSVRRSRSSTRSARASTPTAPRSPRTTPTSTTTNAPSTPF